MLNLAAATLSFFALPKVNSENHVRNRTVASLDVALADG